MAYTTINKPNTHFNPFIYTGGSGNTAQTGVGFQPDLVWIKNRTQIDNHSFTDVIRGARSSMSCNTTDASDTNASAYLVSLDSDGFTTSDTDVVGKNGETYASWNWKAGGTAVSNTAGSITSSVSANTTSGFSIVSYTGTGASATVGHGLGVAPNVIITKKTNGTVQWNFQNSMLGYSQYMALNTNEAAQATGGAIISSVSSTTYSCDGNDVVNASSGTYVSYCFANVKGFSKFGSYLGNGSTDGTFVYTGFKPAFVMLKKTNSATSADWQIQDNKRGTAGGFNPLPRYLEANTSNAEVDWTGSFQLDFVSNGFKFRTNSNQMNNSGDTYIYMAFAEAPIVGSNNVPANAR